MLGNSAEQDYIASRIFALTAIPRLFWWHAQQCVEKYLKCHLVLNGFTDKLAGHCCEELYDKIDQEVLQLLNKLLIPPEPLPFYAYAGFSEEKVRWWPELEVREALRIIDFFGHPDSRYRCRPSQFTGGWLHLLDELTFRLRRIAIPLNHWDGISRSINLQRLRENLDFQPLGELVVRKFHPSRFGKNTGEYAYHLNYSFSPESARSDGRMLNYMSAHGTPLAFLPGRTKIERDVAKELVDQLQMARQTREMLTRNFNDTSPSLPLLQLQEWLEEDLQTPDEGVSFFNF